MTLTPEDREIRVRNHIESSDEFLDGARHNLDVFPRLSAFSSYQAAYHATIALFISDAVPEAQKVHKAMPSLLSEIYVRGEGSLSKDTVKALIDLSKERNLGTYHGNTQMVTKEAATEDLKSAEKYCSAIKTLIQEKANRHSVDQEIGDLEKEVKDLHLVKSDSVKIHTKPINQIEYKGEILHVNESKGYSVQKTGNHTLLVHKNEDLERKPEVGEILKIKYRENEKATIKSVERDHKKQQGLSR